MKGYLKGLSQDKGFQDPIAKPLIITKLIENGFDTTGDWMKKIREGNIRIFLDSGAPSYYNKLSRKKKGGRHAYMGSFMKDRKDDDFSYFYTEDYKRYRRQYVLFTKEYIPYIDTYANLDVINNAELTWENQQYMEAKGLQPIPVWHFGTDIKWLVMYLDRGHEYIAVGGLVPNPIPVITAGMDHIWEKYLTDSDGMPTVKVHGFAVTSAELLFRYPWYSCDSTSWVKFGKYGVVCVPKEYMGEINYRLSPHKVALSDRSDYKRVAGKHLRNYPEADQRALLKYFEEKGCIIGETEYKTVGRDYKLEENERFISGKKGEPEREIEITIIPGLSNDYKLRDQINITYYLDLEKSIGPWPWAFKGGIPDPKLFSFRR